MKTLVTSMLLVISSLSWPATPEMSIYQLNVALVNQDGRSIKLDVYRGEPTLITMFYGNCPSVCPLLFETMQLTERSLNEKQKAHLRVLMISIDPERDTPQALASLAKAHHVDLARWTLARASANDVRKIAAVLNIQYRRLPNGDFNHSSVINAANAQGVIVATTSRLGAVDSSFMEALQKLL